MSILCTFPGRNGDIAWALPTVRAISEHFGEPVDFACCGEFEGLAQLIALQPYIRLVETPAAWGLTPPDEWNPREAIAHLDRYDRVFHLGYRGWPQVSLPFETLLTARRNYPELADISIVDDLARPWITVEGPGAPTEIVVGFTEEWKELKIGLTLMLQHDLIAHALLAVVPRGVHWPAGVSWEAMDWLDTARAIRNADLFVGCCSAPHVLAVAMGVPVILVEPSEARRNPIFYPVGMDGPQVTLVRGNDGEPTFDARAVAEAIHRRLELR